MNKGELINALAKKLDVANAQADKMLNAFIDTVVDTLKAGDEVAITGFGTFSAKKRAARMGVNPRTGTKLQIPAMTVPKFKAGKSFKDALR